MIIAIHVIFQRLDSQLAMILLNALYLSYRQKRVITLNKYKGTYEMVHELTREIRSWRIHNAILDQNVVRLSPDLPTTAALLKE